jgi:hypothetical protein
LFDAATGPLILTLPGHNLLVRSDFGLDGTLLA